MTPLGVARAMDALPSWALDALDAQLPPGNPVLNGRAVTPRLALANTRLGAVLLQRPLVGGVRLTFLEVPARKLAFQCGGCGETLQFLNLELPRRVFCSICAQPYAIDADGQVTASADAGQDAATPADAAAGTQAVQEPDASDEVGLVTMEEMEEPPAPAPAPVSSYDGPAQPVRALEGLAAHAEALEAEGIADTAALRRAPPHVLAQALGVEPALVAQWQAAAELLLVRGIGPQGAETLARAGVRGIDDLKRRTGAAIARQVAAMPDGRAISPARVEAWRSAARTLRKQPVAPAVPAG